MFLVGWLVAHWKVVFAALVAIVFFSYRVNCIAEQQQQQQQQQQEEENTEDTQTAGKQEGEEQPMNFSEEQAQAGATAASPPLNDPAESQQQQPPGEGEAIDTTLDEITGLFANRNPKHALQGVTDAVRNVATGVGLGVAGVAAGTYGGAKEGGWSGMAKGFGAGVCGLVGLTGYGLYAGARQVVRGVGNTPAAVSEVSKGEAYWDSNTQRWVRVDLARDFDALPHTDDDVMAEGRRAYAKAEAAGELPSMAPAPPAQDASASHDGAPAEPSSHADATPPADDEAAAEPADYYAFLGVEKTATTAVIRKAYTRKALEMHPDKNPNDPNATLRFQQLNKIYSVLSNEDSRATYDRYGTVDPKSVPEMATNPMKDMLGAAFLEPLVGQLSFFLVFEGGVLLTSEMVQELHARRRLRVAKQLVGWLDGGAAGLESAQLVLRDAVSTALGPVLVSYVAEQYHLSSRQQLYGSAWAREVDSWYSSWAMSAASLWHWTATGAKTARKAFIEKNLGEEDILRVLAVANESDVKRTVLQACRLVLFDTSVTAEERRQRAVGLEKLSQMAMEEVRRELTSRQSAAAIAAAEARETAPEQSGADAAPPPQ